MLVHFWGTRGSLPASLNAEKVRQKIIKALQAARNKNLGDDRALEEFVDRELPFAVRGTYGGNSSCVEIRGGGECIICDAGTGIRDFGQGAINTPHIYNIFLSHLHWDHLQGFPFFAPAYIPGNRIRIFGCNPGLPEAIATQQESPFFPVPLSAMKAEISFHNLNPGAAYEIGGFRVQAIMQNHPGSSYGFRFEREGRSIIYSTDSEHKKEAEHPLYAFLDFIKETDLLIFDAQYTLLDAIGDKENWGHSNNILAVELAVKAGVKRLCLFHHEHTYDDEVFDELLADTRTYLGILSETSPLKVLMAYDGLEIEI
jgi:phosphoribosyl 1,2-cyclic phosphodiesterase